MCEVDSVRERGFNDDYLDIKELEKTHYTYVLCSSLERKVQYKTLESLGTRPYQFPMVVNTSLAKVGKTSFQLTSRLFDLTQTELFECCHVYVCVDKISRNVSPLPDWWLEKYKDLSDSSVALRVDQMQPPQKTFSHQILVAALDLDYYGHTNNTSYIKYGTETITAAFKNKRISAILWNEDEVHSKVKKITSLYLKDCGFGDMLTGRVWTVKDQIGCVIENNKGEEIYQQFYEFEKDQKEPQSKL